MKEHIRLFAVGFSFITIATLVAVAGFGRHVEFAKLWVCGLIWLVGVTLINIIFEHKK